VRGLFGSDSQLFGLGDFDAIISDESGAIEIDAARHSVATAIGKVPCHVATIFKIGSTAEGCRPDFSTAEVKDIDGGFGVLLYPIVHDREGDGAGGRVAVCGNIVDIWFGTGSYGEGYGSLSVVACIVPHADGESMVAYFQAGEGISDTTTVDIIYRGAVVVGDVVEICFTVEA